MRRIRIVVAYDGTNYCGWQIQPNGITIEEILNRQISKLTGEDIRIIGASRTDSGVHALGNVAVFDTESRIPGDRFAYALNQKMPEDIVIVRSDEVQIDWHPTAAYKALESANVIMGVSKVQNLAHSAVLENSVKVDLRSVMGVEIPVVTADKPDGRPVYGFNGTSSALDEASVKFNEVKVMTVKLTEIENAVYRLAMNIKKTQKRANALENITIPLYDKLSKDIQNALEEKEREEHTRLKIIKRTKEKQG